MTARDDGDTSQTIELSSGDLAFLLSLLRDPTLPQPVTTQQLIDALRGRSGE